MFVYRYETRLQANVELISRDETKKILRATAGRDVGMLKLTVSEECNCSYPCSSLRVDNNKRDNGVSGGVEPSLRKGKP